jgi:hypothetical protein
MPEDPLLTCEEARQRLAADPAGEHCPALAEHLAACEECLDAFLDAALRQPADFAIPSGFAARVVARLPERIEPDVLEIPWLAVAASGSLVSFGVLLWGRGELLPFAHQLTAVLLRPDVLAATIAIETIAAFWWLWRISGTE